MDRSLLPVVLTLTLALLGCTPRPPAQQCAADPLVARSLDDLAQFTGWLQRHGARGVVGETGWPAGGQWESLARTWWDAAADADVGVLVWAAAEQWPPDYPLAAYRSSDGAGRLDSAGPQAALLEQRSRSSAGTGSAGTGPTLTGVALAGGSFGTSQDASGGYSAAQPGTYGQSYRYPSAASLRWLAGRGVGTVRLAFTWERVQREPGGPLDSREVDRLRQVLRAAADAGVAVVLDLHSYGRFRAGGAAQDDWVLGSDELPATSLATLWRGLAGALGTEPALAGYGLMNEPHDLPGGAATWQLASQLAVEALRTVDSRTPVLVAGHAHSSAARWPVEHPTPWLRDPAGAVVYEAHQYFDGGGSGAYGRSYDDEVSAAQADGWTACGPPAG